MKKILSLVFVSFTLLTLTFAQSNKVGSGTNFYNTANLIGKSLPALGATGGTVLVYVDYALASDGVISSLTTSGFAVTTATSWSNFNTLLSGGSYNLAVAFAQNQSAISYGFSTTIAQNYITGGGRMIFATWTTEDASILPIFDAAFTGNFNRTTVTITDQALAHKLTSPFELTNPGWGIFSTCLSAITGGKVLAKFENGDGAIILGNDGRTMVLGYLSDTPEYSKEAIFHNISSYLVNGPVVPIPYVWIILAFVLIATGVVFAKRKVIFS